jgi:hypothetical protein
MPSGIGHLVVVAGHSGSGKSTFVEKLAAADLPREIMARLPFGAEKWIQLKTAGADFWFPLVIESAKRKAIPGAVFHYNIVRRKLVDFDYHSDRALEVMKLAKRITVVNIRPSSEQIVSQLVYREVEAPTKRKRFIGKLLRRGAELARPALMLLVRVFREALIVRYKLLHGVYRLWDKLNPPSVNVNRSGNVSPKIDHYQRSGWLEETFQLWQDYLQTLAQDGMPVEQIYLEPDPKAKIGEDYRWRLASQRTQS